MEKQQIKVGDSVEVKYDVEQVGKVEKITTDFLRRKVYHVRCFHGGYVADSNVGDVVQFCESDIFGGAI